MSCACACYKLEVIPTFSSSNFIIAGKAVFCEKPIAATDEATANCYDKAAEAGVPLFCSFNRYVR